MSSVCGMSSSLYNSGETVISNPIESSSIFLVVVLLCACMEYLFTLAGEIKSKFFNEMFETISEEILVVGVLSLLLSFGSSIPNSIPDSWCIMIQWTHVCLLFMGAFFVLTMVLMTVVTFSHSSSLAKFELTRIGSRSFELSRREIRHKMAYQHFRLCCQIHDIVEDQDCVSFADYILKTEKEQLILLGDLTWRSWLGLTVMVVVNACRTRVPALVDALASYRDTVDIASYIGLMGFVPIAIFWYLSSVLDRRFDQFIEKRGVTASGDREGLQKDLDDPLMLQEGQQGSETRPSDLDDPRSFLLWQTPESTLAILQMILLALVWYAAVFCLNMLYITFTLSSIYQTVIFIVAAFIPLIVLIVFLPRTLFLVALLSSLGSCFNEPRVRAMIAVAKGDAVNTDAVRLEEKKSVVSIEQRDGNNSKGGGSPQGGGGGGIGAASRQASTIIAVKKPPPPLLIDDQALLRLANTAGERDLI